MKPADSKPISPALVAGLVSLCLAVPPAAAGQGPAATPVQQGATAPLLSGMGKHTHPITTDDPLTQRYFDQGLVLAWGFNHAEAERSFREAARRDPDCAICWWGAALVLGPNINAPMEPDAVPVAWEAIQRARALAADAEAGASELERAYVEALATRYAESPPEDRKPLDEAYARAMGEVARRFPDDLDARVLHAEALMDLHPWDFWTKEGAAQPWTGEIVDILEGVLARQPDHPGALHLYIHAVEASPQPERAEAAADRLRDLVPGAGHLVHMPGHIYYRIGRYADASEANRRAIEADAAYVAECHSQGLYPVAYVPHNQHFLWAATTMEGASGAALAAARHMAEHTDGELMREPGYGTLQHYWVTPLYALARFGRWSEVLEAPAPDDELVYPRGVYHYARGLALVRRGRLDEAARELAALERLAADPRLEEVTIWDINGTADLLAIASGVLAGELAAARGDHETAIALLEKAVAREDDLNYDEPPPWHAPVRHFLGAVLLDAGRPAAAETVYLEDLRRHPENGWSLFGLARSLRAQGKLEAAAGAEARFAAAWAGADLELESSRF